MEEAGLNKGLLPITIFGQGSSSVRQATFNNVGVIVGLGMLSCPYALYNSGWLGLIFLVFCGSIFCYTAHLLGICLRSKPGCSTYQQVAEHAFGTSFRYFTSLVAILGLLGSLVGFTISLRDNLVKLIPNVSLTYSWLHIPGSVLLPTLAVLIVLPIIWLRNLSWVSYVSLGGIFAYLLIVVAVLWAGLFDGIGFHHRNLTTLNPSGLAEVSGLYLFSYSAHFVCPRICSAMKEPSQYSKVAVLSNLIATVIYVVLAVAGATMFGDAIESQVTLNLPTDLAVAKLALWVVILIPLTKFPLSLNPLAVDIESFVSHRGGNVITSVCIKTLIMATVLILAFSMPSFETTLGLLGSVLTTLECIILPCVFHMKIFRTTISKKQATLNSGLVVVGVLLATVGSSATIKRFIHST